MRSRLAPFALLLLVAGATPPPLAGLEAPMPTPMPTPVDPLALQARSPPSPFGRLLSSRWALGATYVRTNLAPVKNPHPSPEPQPRRDHPFDVELSADGRKLYVSLLGSELQPGDSLAVIDVEREALLPRIPLRATGEPGPAASGPFRLLLHPGGRFLVVSARYSNFLSVIDTVSDRVVAEIPLDFYAQGMTFDADGRTLFVTDRYLDQLLVVDVQVAGDRFEGKLRVLGGLSLQDFTKEGPAGSPHAILVQRCGGCHAQGAGGLQIVADAARTFRSVLRHVEPGAAAESRLLRAVLRTRHGGYADRSPRWMAHGEAGPVFLDPAEPQLLALRAFLDAGGPGPGIPIGNPRSKPKTVARSSDGRHLFVGTTGTQNVSIVSLAAGREIGTIELQNVVNDLELVRGPDGHDWLLVTTEGVGFGVLAARDPYGGESLDPKNPAAQYTVHRSLETGATLPKPAQHVLGPYDAVDGTAAIKFRDVQNDLVLVDVTALGLKDEAPAGPIPALLHADRYEAHAGWVRYTSDTAEATAGDIKGDLPPELQRVVGAFPEKIAQAGGRLYVTMQASNEIAELQLRLDAADPSDRLVPLRSFPVGLQPIGLVAGVDGTKAEGKLFAANFLSGSVSIVELATGATREVIVDPSVLARPVPDTNAERGEVLAHSALFSSDGDTSCFHCHYLDLGDGRPWGVSQVVSQEYLPDGSGQLVIGGAMGVPQMRNLFTTQPFFLEGTLSAFEPRSMLMEHAPAEDFSRVTPQGDFTALLATSEPPAVADVQSSMSSAGAAEATLDVRRDAMFRDQSMRLFGKAFTLRDFVRFVGEWQISEPRLLPNPFDREAASVERGRALFEAPQVGCVACHAPPDFSSKPGKGNVTQAHTPVVTVTRRDTSFTLLSMNRLDAIAGVERDLEPWDAGRAEAIQGRYTNLPLRGLWDRPPVFLHGGTARSLREILCTPGHPALRNFPHELRLGGERERPGRRELGLNETDAVPEALPRTGPLQAAGGRIGIDTHGGTSQLDPSQIDDLVDFLEAIE